MKTIVRYFTRGGNTKKLADAIAEEVGVQAKECFAPITEQADLLFLGGSVYWGGIDKNLKQFIAQLDKTNVKCVAVFGTSALKKEPDREIEKLIREKGITVLSSSFHCRGAFTAMHKGRPDSNDLKEVKAFARNALKEVR